MHIVEHIVKESIAFNEGAVKLHIGLLLRLDKKGFNVLECRFICHFFSNLRKLVVEISIVCDKNLNVVLFDIGILVTTFRALSLYFFFLPL